MTDRPDYPTDAELQRIKGWPYTDTPGWLEYIASIWHWPDWGIERKERDGELYLHLSTGGWSGNESIVDAMQENHWAWAQTWYSSRRGGHYIFILPSKKKK